MSSSLHRVVRETLALGLALALLALAVLRDAGAVLPLGAWLPGSGQLLIVALLLLTMLANLLAVPVRRGDHVEELTLLESAVIVDVLLLPASTALWLPVAAVVLSSVLTRRNALKSLFNAGSLAASTALLVLLVHLCTPAGAGLSWQTVAGLVAGLLAFTAVNLANLTRVLAALQEAEAPSVLSDGWRLALLTLPGHLSIAGAGVLAASAAPALVPFAFVPAVALVFAFRARAHEVSERTRAARLVELSHVLAVRRDGDEVVTTFLRLCRDAFDVDVALAVFAGEPALGEPALGEPAAGERVAGEPGQRGPYEVQLNDRRTGPQRHPADDHEIALLNVMSTDGTGAMLPHDRPRRWWRPDGAAGVLAPLEAEGERLGVVVLRGSGRSRRMARRELLLLTPMTNLLAAALQASAQLRRLTDATSSLQAVVDQSSDGILVLDGAGVVQLWSPAVSTLTGHDGRGAIGQRLDELWRVRASDGQPCDAFGSGRALLSPSHPQATVELELVRTDGESRLVRCAHAASFVGDRLLRDVVLVHDVTRERQVERLKADFIATVSHELRTPVTPIKGYADLLLRRGDAMSTERRNECLAVISDRSAHLARLVEDLLLASRFSASEGALTRHVDLAEADLVPLVRRAAADFGDDTRRVRVLVPDGALRVALDPMRTVQVLTNLIGNALKYSARGSLVDVACSRSGSSAVVAVTDRGRGIPADQVERVFDKFHRVEDPLRMTTSGTGLGLYIARQLAEAMGGTLICRSTLGAGSTFRFTLPLADTPTPRDDGLTALPVPRRRAEGGVAAVTVS